MAKDSEKVKVKKLQPVSVTDKMLLIITEEIRLVSKEQLEPARPSRMPKKY